MQKWFSITAMWNTLLNTELSKCSVKLMPLRNIETYERTNRLPYILAVRTKMWQIIYDNFVRLPDNLKHNISYEKNNIAQII